MHFYTVQLQNTVFRKDKFKVSYVLISISSDCSKTINGKNINKCYLQMKLITFYHLYSQQYQIVKMV